MDEQKENTKQPTPAKNGNSFSISAGTMAFIMMVIAIVGLLAAGLFAFSERPTTAQVRQKIRDYAAPREQVVRMEECLKGIKTQLDDLKTGINHRLDKIEERLPVKTANGSHKKTKDGD